MTRLRLLLVGLAVLPLAAQSDTSRFEVVSIKPHNPAIDYTSSGPDGLEWTGTNFSLLRLVGAAYPGYTGEGRIIAGERWMRETTFEIRAKGTGPLSYPALYTMLQTMLAERFRLRTHVEQRLFDVYVARLTSADGTPGQADADSARRRLTEFGWLYSPGWLGIYNGDLLGLGGFAVVAVATLCLALRKRKRA